MNRTDVRQVLGSSDSTTVIVSATRMEGLKGLDVLLEALRRMPPGLEWHTWVIGGAQRRVDAGFLSALKETARRLGVENRVRFLGQRSDVSRLLAAADVYCQPNTGPESFGVSFVEALYSGLPVVTTAMGGALEIVDASCGVLTPPDSGAVTRALAALVTNEPYRRRLAEAAPRRARMLCDPVQQTRALAGILAGSLPPLAS
jgi:glycosyltransferase involved in cell wall biosynthesis